MTQTTEDTGVLDTLRRAVDTSTAGRVFGEPVIQDDVVLLPVAKIAGGGGGGGGTGPTTDGPEATGAGGGFGTSAKGLGVFVLRNGKVSWHPAIDVNRIVLGGQIVAITALLVARSVLHGRAGRGGAGRGGAGRGGAGRGGRARALSRLGTNSPRATRKARRRARALKAAAKALRAQARAKRSAAPAPRTH